MVIQQTSIEAYHSLKSHDLSRRQAEVLKLLNESFFGLSNRLIAKRLNKPINQITPRTNELVKMGLVVEQFRTKDVQTHKNVIFWGIKND